jgi:hypothetical protein
VSARGATKARPEPRVETKRLGTVFASLWITLLKY